MSLIISLVVLFIKSKDKCFEGKNNEMMKKRSKVMTNSVHRKKLPSSNDGETYWKGVVLPSALYGAEVIDMKGE